MEIFEDQRAQLVPLAEHVANRLSEDNHVSAVWLEGSLARGEEDALSDIDLVIVLSPKSSQTVLRSLQEKLPIAGQVALVHEAPQNAPAEGAQLNVLYDLDPLPVYVDWNFWPAVPARPTDVIVLFEREAFAPDPSATLASILGGLQRGRGSQPTEEVLNHFRVFMAPILAKHAARGWFESVNQMLGYMQLDGPQITSLSETIELARRILRDFGSSETQIALSCIQRYLTLVSSYPEDRQPP